MQPPQNQEVDGTPSNSIGAEINSKAWIDKHLDKLLGHPHKDAGIQYNHIEYFFREYSESLDKDQVSAIRDKLLRCIREKEQSRWANVIAKYDATIGAGPCDPVTNTAISLDPTLPTTQQNKRGELCAKFPRNVQRQYKKLDMWYSKTDRQNFRRDRECKAIVKEYKDKLADNPGTI